MTTLNTKIDYQIYLEDAETDYDPIVEKKSLILVGGMFGAIFLALYLGKNSSQTNSSWWKLKMMNLI